MWLFLDRSELADPFATPVASSVSSGLLYFNHEQYNVQ